MSRQWGDGWTEHQLRDLAFLNDERPTLRQRLWYIVKNALYYVAVLACVMFIEALVFLALLTG